MTLSVDEDCPLNEGEETLVRGVRQSFMDRIGHLQSVPGVSALLVEDVSRKRYVFLPNPLPRSNPLSGLRTVNSVAAFERDWLVDFVLLAGGGPHVKVRISVCRPMVSGKWNAYAWVPGEDAEDAACRLMAASVMLS